LYVVTGGAGFIGSHIVQRLLARGEKVRIADDFSSGKRENVPEGVEVVEGDVADPAVAARAAAGCEFVIHQAAIPSVPRSVKDPVRSHRANVDGTLNMLIAARDAGAKRLVFAGSSSVYGDTPVLPKREDMRPNPLSPYALQKLIGEQYCQMFTRLYGLETVVTRYFNVFGPRQQPGSPYSGVISLFVEALAQGKSPHIHGDGEQTRDFTYVGDVVTGVLECCSAPGVAGEVINVAAGGRVSLLELIRSLQGILKTSAAPTFGPTREGDVKDSQADIAKARKLLNFAPSVPFDEGLRETVAWFQGRATGVAGRLITAAISDNRTENGT
jgi:nucleoside-diphosphate-sugar epimerase